MGGVIAAGNWNAAGSPYIVAGDVTVPVGGSLDIGPGTVVRFATTDMTGGGDPTECELRIIGRLTVAGSAAQPVVFESVGSSGQWDGIILAAGSSASTIRNAQITEAEIGLRVEATPTAL